MSRESLQAFKQTVTVQWPKKQEADAKALLIRVARDGHQRIIAKQGASAFEAYANRPGNPVDSVVLPGPIVYKYRFLREVVTFTLDALRKASPVNSGTYASSHTIYVNGIPVETVPLDLKTTDEVFIANPVAYSRRLEIGKTESGRAFVLQVEPRIYERTLKSVLIPKYRNAAKMSFGYVLVPGGHVVKGKLKSHYIAKGGARRKRRQRVGEAVRSPAIFFELHT